MSECDSSDKAWHSVQQVPSKMYSKQAAPWARLLALAASIMSVYFACHQACNRSKLVTQSCAPDVRQVIQVGCTNAASRVSRGMASHAAFAASGGASGGGTLRGLKGDAACSTTATSGATAVNAPVTNSSLANKSTTSCVFSPSTASIKWSVWYCALWYTHTHKLQLALCTCIAAGCSAH